MMKMKTVKSPCNSVHWKGAFWGSNGNMGEFKVKLVCINDRKRSFMKI